MKLWWGLLVLTGAILVEQERPVDERLARAEQVAMLQAAPEHVVGREAVV